MAARRSDPIKTYMATVKAHRAVLDRLMDRQGMIPLKRVYDRMQNDLERDLLRQLGPSRSKPLTPLQAQLLIQQVKIKQQQLASQLAKTMLLVIEEAQEEGIREIAKTVAKEEWRFVGGAYIPTIDEPVALNRLTEKRKVELGKVNTSAWERLAVGVSTEMEETLGASLAEEEDGGSTVERLRQKADDMWWMGARLIHTVTAKAFNTAQADGIDEIGKDIPTLQKRWCELVDDATGAPLDERVGQDSIVLHGQVVKRTGFFVMPPDLRVTPKMWGHLYFSSPNRPNDRSVTMPWQPGMGVPGWEWKNGQRVLLP